MAKSSLEIYCDGGARGNPGPAAAAIVVIKDGKIIHKESKYLGKTTNNFAEYQSAILALRWLVNNQYQIPGKKVLLVLDSKLVASQLSGDYKIKSKALRQLYFVTKKLEEKVSVRISYTWSPRTKNKLADFLVNKELDKNAR